MKRLATTILCANHFGAFPTTTLKDNVRSSSVRPKGQGTAPKLLHVDQPGIAAAHLLNKNMTRPMMPRQKHEAGGTWRNDTRQALRGIIAAILCALLAACATSKTPAKPAQYNVNLSPMQRVNQTIEHSLEVPAWICDTLFSRIVIALPGFSFTLENRVPTLDVSK